MSIIGRFIKAIISRIREKRECTEEEVRTMSTAERDAALNELAAASPYKNWRASVQDLGYLVGEDGSYDGRETMWKEAKLPGKYTGSAEQNRQLSDHILDQISKGEKTLPQA